MGDLFSLAAMEAEGRRRQMLRTAFGPAIATALADPTVIEVMVNPDGRLWLDKAGSGRVDTGEHLGAAEAERIIRLVAAHVHREVHDGAPIISAELPETGERFEGLIPPIATAPCFSIRKPAGVIYSLADYVAAGIASPRQADLRHPVSRRPVLELAPEPRACDGPIAVRRGRRDAERGGRLGDGEPSEVPQLDEPRSLGVHRR